MNRVMAEGYWKMRDRAGREKAYFARVIVDGEEQRLCKKCRTASEAVAYGHQVVKRLLALQRVAVS
jgi:hypothetical protein